MYVCMYVCTYVYIYIMCAVSLKRYLTSRHTTRFARQYIPNEDYAVKVLCCPHLVETEVECCVSLRRACVLLVQVALRYTQPNHG